MAAAGGAVVAVILMTPPVAWTIDGGQARDSFVTIVVGWVLFAMTLPVVIARAAQQTGGTRTLHGSAQRFFFAVAVAFITHAVAPLASATMRLIDWSTLGARLIGDHLTLKIICAIGVLQVVDAALQYRRHVRRAQREVEIRTELTKARLQALRSQLNPHFLFNALNSAAELGHSRPESAATMIRALGALFRRSLGTQERQFVTLTEELSLLELYLSIERERFGKRLTVLRNVSGAAHACLVPDLVLQPLVENAVRHGLAGRHGGRITISAWTDVGQLWLRVEDDGRGIQPDALVERVGLSNSRQRLQALYGTAQQLTVSAGRSGGTVAEVMIPAQDAGQWTR